MKDSVIPIWERTDQLTQRARSLRAMARERHILAVRHLEGDRLKFMELLRDCDAHESEARRLESQRDGILEGRRETVRALEHLVETMRAARAT